MSRIPLPLVGIILLGLLVGVYLFGWKRFAKQAPTIKRHSVETPADDTLKYWTVDKMRKAKPTKLPNVTAVERKKQPPQA